VFVPDPKKLLRRAKEHAPDPFYYLDKRLSLPKDGVKRIDDVDFDTLFEQTLFKSKSKTCLDEIVFDEKRFLSLIPNKIFQVAVIPTQRIPPVPNPPRVMVTRFTPLSLPSQLHSFPHNYNQRIKLYDAKGNACSQKHFNWFNDFSDLEEVDHEEVKMILFSQSLSWEVRKFFKAL